MAQHKSNLFQFAARAVAEMAHDLRRSRGASFGLRRSSAGMSIRKPCGRQRPFPVRARSDVFGWDFQRVAIKDDEICEFTDLQGACDVVFVEFIGGVNRSGSQNRFAREARVFPQLTVELRWGAGRIRARHTDLRKPSSSASTGQSLPKVMRAPAAASNPAGSRIFMRSGPK